MIDGFTIYDAYFKTNPTLEDFVNWLLEHESNVYGFIIDTTDSFSKIYVEYGEGKIFKLCENYNEIKNKTIFLTNIREGWARKDYSIGFIE